MDDKVTLALAVVSALSQPVLDLPFPADLALIAVIVVKMGLDRFCECKETRKQVDKALMLSHVTFICSFTEAPCPSHPN